MSIMARARKETMMRNQYRESRPFAQSASRNEVNPDTSKAAGTIRERRG